MRALAILMVLSSHILWIYPKKESLLSQFFTLFGFLGVEMFFVLSGFLIGTILYNTYQKEDFTLKIMMNFLKRRWYRTLPNYYLFFLVNIIIAFIIGFSINDWWKYPFFLQNVVTTMLPFYPESWSLAIEEYAYVLFPLALVLMPSKIEKKYKFLFILIGMLLFFLFTKIFYNYTTTNITINQWNISLKNVVVYRVDAILYGILFSWIAQNYSTAWIKYKWIALFFSFIFMSILYVGVGFFQFTIEKAPLFWNVFYLPLTSLSVGLLLPILSQWKTTKLPIKKPVVFISLTSYSFYLIHYGIVLQLMKYFFPTENYSFNQLHLYLLLFLVLSFTLSYINFRFFEKPMMDLRDK